MKTAEQYRLRTVSGEVTDSSPLVAFFYLLARDTACVGAIESILDQSLDITAAQPALYTNGWLARWAQDVAGRFVRAEDMAQTDGVPLRMDCRLSGLTGEG